MTFGSYKLDDGRNPVPCTTAEAGRLLSSSDAARRVALTELPNGKRVSTVFLVIDHSYGLSPEPILFETMVFQGEDNGDLDCDRYATWAEAEAGHAAMVAQHSDSPPGGARPLAATEEP